MPLDEKNDWTAPGAAASLRMNFSEPDLAPDLELNQIIWEAVRGRGFDHAAAAADRLHQDRSSSMTMTGSV